MSKLVDKIRKNIRFNNNLNGANRQIGRSDFSFEKHAYFSAEKLLRSARRPAQGFSKKTFAFQMLK